jgi:hypothetical protein
MNLRSSRILIRTGPCHTLRAKLIRQCASAVAFFTSIRAKQRSPDAVKSRVKKINLK